MGHGSWLDGRARRATRDLSRRQSRLDGIRLAARATLVARGRRRSTSGTASRRSPRTEPIRRRGATSTCLRGRRRPRCLVSTTRTTRRETSASTPRSRTRDSRPTDDGPSRRSARYGVSAHDDAPVLVAVATPPSTVVTRGFYDRSFTPWNARGSVDWAATPDCAHRAWLSSTGAKRTTRSPRGACSSPTLSSPRPRRRADVR